MKRLVFSVLLIVGLITAVGFAAKMAMAAPNPGWNADAVVDVNVSITLPQFIWMRGLADGDTITLDTTDTWSFVEDVPNTSGHITATDTQVFWLISNVNAGTVTAVVKTNPTNGGISVVPSVTDGGFTTGFEQQTLSITVNADLNVPAGTNDSAVVTVTAAPTP